MSHTHVHTHDYAHRKHTEFVAIDIGEDTGALIVHTDADMHGVEVELSPADDDRARGHKQVLERTIAGRPAFTLLFDGLPAGSYKLWHGAKPVVRIKAGAITELDWRSSDSHRDSAAEASVAEARAAEARSRTHEHRRHEHDPR